MNKLAAIAFAAGLSIAHGSCKNSSPLDDCKHILPTEERLLNVKGVKNECDELHEKETREHCLKMVEQTRSSALSACMTRQKKAPVLCDYQNGVWDCKTKKIEAANDRLTWMFK